MLLDVLELRVPVSGRTVPILRTVTQNKNTAKWIKIARALRIGAMLSKLASMLMATTLKLTPISKYSQKNHIKFVALIKWPMWTVRLRPMRYAQMFVLLHSLFASLCVWLRNGLLTLSSTICLLSACAYYHTSNTFLLVPWANDAKL